MRVIALVDMDCFYCQVEEKLNPELQGKPVGVVQYNLWREGGLIAVNYLAKEKGVTKGMWKHEAKDLCPDIQFARVAELRGRADLTKYREAGKQVVDVLSTFSILLERASIDEAYLDLTEAVERELSKGITNIPLEDLKTTHIVGGETADFISYISSAQDTDGFCRDDLKLAVGAIIVERMRAGIFEKTGYRCSAGIAQNKILAKLVCGLHKPNKQTILPGNAIPQFLSELPLKKIKRLGGKFGRKVSEKLNVNNVRDLLQFSEEELSRQFDSKTGHWLYNIARGIDNEPVLQKLLSKSISCCKRFPGKNALYMLKDIEYWTKELAIEVAQRLVEDREQNNRKAKMATISFVQYVDNKDVNISKSFSLRSYDAGVISQDALKILTRCCQKTDGLYYLKYLGISVGTFESLKNVKDIKFFLEKQKSKIQEAKVPINNDSNNEDVHKKSTNISSFSTSEDMHQKSNNISSFSTSEDVHQKSNNISSFSTSEDVHQKSNIISSFSTSEDVHQKSNNNSSFSTCQKPNIGFSENGINEVIQTIDEQNERTESCEKNIPEKFIFSQMKFEEEIEKMYEHVDENSFFVRYFNRIANEINIDATDEISSRESGKKRDESNENSVHHIERRKVQKCEYCDEEIDIDEIGIHIDHHVATKIHEENLSIQNETEKKLDHQSTKKRKLSEVGNESTDSYSSVHGLNFTEMCEICNQPISISEIQNHSDYHTAKNLDKIWNMSVSPNSKHKNEKKTKGNNILSYLKRKTS